MLAAFTPVQLRRAQRLKCAGLPIRAARWARENLATIALWLLIAVVVGLYCLVGWRLLVQPVKSSPADESFGKPARLGDG